jgi:hypothetical protein
MKNINLTFCILIAVFFTSIFGYWYFHYMKIIIDNNNFPQMAIVTIVAIFIIWAIFHLSFQLKSFFKK